MCFGDKDSHFQKKKNQILAIFIYISYFCANNLEA